MKKCKLKAKTTSIDLPTLDFVMRKYVNQNKMISLIEKRLKGMDLKFSSVDHKLSFMEGLKQGYTLAHIEELNESPLITSLCQINTGDHVVFALPPLCGMEGKIIEISANPTYIHPIAKIEFLPEEYLLVEIHDIKQIAAVRKN